MYSDECGLKCSERNVSESRFSDKCPFGQDVSGLEVRQIYEEILSENELKKPRRECYDRIGRAPCVSGENFLPEASGEHLTAKYIKNGEVGRGRIAYELRSSKKRLDYFAIDNSLSNYCKDCECEYSDAEHMTSTVHLLATKTPIPHPGYKIPSSNKGYQILKRSGWNELKGLGKNGDGNRYPIKTVLKCDRAGLGIERPKTRVTHFEAYDELCVQNAKNLSKRQLKDEEMHFKNMWKQYEIDFRLMFKHDQ